MGTVLSRRGSILILVLWILALLAYLATDYLARNREKSVVRSTLWNEEKVDQAINSVIALFSIDRSPLSGQEEERQWISLSPGGVELWVKVENEGSRVNLNSAADPDIRQKLTEITADDEKQGDLIADAILDWRDPDKLTRLNGAEEDYYEDEGLGYGPADGPFKALTELLLVRGVTPELFWGDPLCSVTPEGEDQKETEEKAITMSDAFTIFDGKVRRLSIIVPGRGKSYQYVMVFMKKKRLWWEAFQIYRTTLISSNSK